MAVKPGFTLRMIDHCRSAEFLQWYYEECIGEILYIIYRKQISFNAWRIS